jgi:hypothetical protein
VGSGGFLPGVVAEVLSRDEEDPGLDDLAFRSGGSTVLGRESENGIHLSSPVCSR